MGTSLVDEVIGALEKVELFDADSLKALRATCTVFRDLVDSTNASLNASFDLSYDGRELLGTWAAGTRLTPRTRSLFIGGEVPAELAGEVLAALHTHRPPISKLELVGVGVATEQLLTAPFDTLRELGVYSPPNSRALIQMIDNASFNGLQSLELDAVDDIEASDLAALLAHFRDLQILTLSEIRLKGSLVDSKALRNALPRLESLTVSNCPDVEKLGLLGAAGPAMPALRSLELSYMTLSTAPLCFGNITKLNLDSVRLTSPEVAALLCGGPLEDLRIFLGFELSSYANWNCSSLNLPHLTRLKLPLYPGDGDAMGDAAQARLPNLRSISLPFGPSTPVASVQTFSTAFQHLRDLAIGGRWNQVHPASVLEAIFREIVPRLKSLQCYANFNKNEITTILHSLLPAGPADGAPCWPRLRSLELNLSGSENRLTPEIQIPMYQALARAAPHTPSLVSLRAIFGDGACPEALDAFVAAAKEVKAWPLMRNICIQVSYQDRQNSAEKFNEIWPQLTVEWEQRWMAENAFVG